MWILLYLLFLPFSPTIDLQVANWFYSPEQGFYDNAFLHFLFTYGELFGFVVGCVASALFALSFWRPRYKQWRRGALVMMLVLAIGAGLMVNLLLKEHWGRPRPKQITAFGGKHTYRPVWKPQFYAKEHQRSFPSGHVAIGAYFLTLLLVGRRYRSRLLFGLGIALSLFWGGGLLVARVAQGGHFVSDALASLVFMWYMAKITDHLVFTSKNPFLDLMLVENKTDAVEFKQGLFGYRSKSSPH